MGVLSKRPSLSQQIQGKGCLTQRRSAPFDKLVRVITRSAFARTAASVFIAGALLVGTSGCVFFTKTATLIQYDPSDGIGASVGEVEVRNALGIMGEDGDAISLMITLINSGDRAAGVRLQYSSGGEDMTTIVRVGAGSTVSLGNELEGDQLLIVDPDVAAGDLLPVYVQYGDNEGVQMLVPVVEATGVYAELGPR